MARPVEVLYGETLESAKSPTLGETVAKLPGVQADYFGPGVGKPIIRGQEGPRIQILSNGIGTMDVSTLSADHAIGIEPFLADQIEVLKGPATLFFGSGAIGGAVNVVDGRIARIKPTQPLSGRAELRTNTVNNEKTGMFRLDKVVGDWIIHVDGIARNTDDYDIPGYALTHDLRTNENASWAHGRLPDSSIKTRSGALGATWLGAQGYFGIAANAYRSDYGIPAGAHLHVDDDHAHAHDHDESAHSSHDAEAVRIDLRQNRFDLKTGIHAPTDWLTGINLRAGYTDYQHRELEAGQTATRFTNNGFESRLEAVQSPLAGWTGAFGLHFSQSDFTAKGNEAFVPDTKAKGIGLFILEERQWGAVKAEFGARYDHVRLSPQSGFRDRAFDVFNLAIAGTWQLSDPVELRAGLDRSERAPANEELYANGAHIATRTFEIGNANLRTERGHRAEIGLHAHIRRADFKFALYQTQFKNFIYLADTGIESEVLPVRLWTQQDAVFKGAEAEAVFHLADSSRRGTWDLRIFGDYVQAKLNGSQQSRATHAAIVHGDHIHHHDIALANRGYLPRIAPARLGLDVMTTYRGFRGSVGAVHTFRQNDVAMNENASPSHTLVDAHFALQWRPGTGTNTWEVFLDMTNLTNQEVRSHTSLLRDYAPLPGRAVALGIRTSF